MVAVLLLAAGCNLGNNGVRQSNESKTQEQLSEEQRIKEQQEEQQRAAEAMKSKTYENAVYGFSFSKPPYFNLKEGKAAQDDHDFFAPVESRLTGGAVKVVTVSIPKGSYPATDFDGAFFNVSVSKDLTAEQCSKFRDLSGQAVMEKKTIGGVKFSGGSDGSAATGHQAYDRFYHAYRGGICYELNEGVRTGGFGASENIKSQVDRNAVFAELDSVMNTFTFIPITAEDMKGSSNKSQGQAKPATATSTK